MTLTRRALLGTAVAALVGFAAISGSQADQHGSMGKDIISVATEAGQFKTLVAAIEAAGLTATLKGPGPFTVFAPTDDAFGKLPAGTVESLLEPANKDKLAGILKYHVVSGSVMSADIAGKTMDVGTVQGSTIAVNATEGVKVNNGSVVKADIKASNGVIHVIDTVLLPK